ncbi:MAG: hypothetical protein ACXVZ1_11860 [Gaiellaceae bacterium]
MLNLNIRRTRPSSEEGDDLNLRIMIERMAREGRTEREIEAAVRSATESEA